jgi:hypothetical protein
MASGTLPNLGGAALLATRRRGDDVTLENFTQAIERILAGLEKRNRIFTLADGISLRATRLVMLGRDVAARRQSRAESLDRTCGRVPWQAGSGRGQ